MASDSHKSKYSALEMSENVVKKAFNILHSL